MTRSLLVATICASLLAAGCKAEPAAAPPAPIEAPKPVAAPAPAAAPAPEPAAAPPAAEAWQALQTAAFSIDVPGAAKMQEGVEQTKAGDVKTTTWSVQTQTAFYAVSSADYPKGMMSTAVQSKVLEGARDGAMANVGGKIDKDLTVFLDSQTPNKKYQGREFDGTTAAGIKMAARLFLVGDRLFQMISVGPVAQFNADDFKKFADSFKLKAEAPAPSTKPSKRKK